MHLPGRFFRHSPLEKRHSALLPTAIHRLFSDHLLLVATHLLLSIHELLSRTHEPRPERHANVPLEYLSENELTMSSVGAA